MTASAIQGDREKCLESGMNDYLAKPVRSAVLKKKIEQYITSPITTPNLRADARTIARAVLNEVGNASTPGLDAATVSVLPHKPKMPNRGSSESTVTPEVVQSQKQEHSTGAKDDAKEAGTREKREKRHK